MSKKKDRAWFVCPRWTELVSRHYASDIEAGRALKADPKVLSKLRTGTPVAKSTVLKMFRHCAGRHNLGSAAADLLVDTRSRWPVTATIGEVAFLRLAHSYASNVFDAASRHTLSNAS